MVKWLRRNDGKPMTDLPPSTFLHLGRELHGNHAHRSVCRCPGRSTNLKIGRPRLHWLTEILGLPPVAAKHQARQSRGFLAANLPGEMAQRFRDACAGRGIAVQVVPQSDVIPVIKPVRVHHVWITDDALCVQALGQEGKTRLAWDTLRLIAVTDTTRKESFQHWPTPRRTPIITPQVTRYTEEFAEHLADLFALSPQGVVLGVRLFSRQVNYAEALGDMAPDALLDAEARSESFCLLLTSIAARATQVYIPPESRARLTQATPGSAPASLDDFDAYNRWTLQRLRLQGSRQGGVGLP